MIIYRNINTKCILVIILLLLLSGCSKAMIMRGDTSILNGQFSDRLYKNWEYKDQSLGLVGHQTGFNDWRYAFYQNKNRAGRLFLVRSGCEKAYQSLRTLRKSHLRLLNRKDIEKAHMANLCIGEKLVLPPNDSVALLSTAKRLVSSDKSSLLNHTKSGETYSQQEKKLLKKIRELEQRITVLESSSLVWTTKPGTSITSKSKGY